MTKPTTTTPSREDKILRCRMLAKDPNYPSAEILEAVAGKVADYIRDTDELNRF